MSHSDDIPSPLRARLPGATSPFGCLEELGLHVGLPLDGGLDLLLRLNQRELHVSELVLCQEECDANEVSRQCERQLNLARPADTIGVPLRGVSTNLFWP